MRFGNYATLWDSSIVMTEGQLLRRGCLTIEIQAKPKVYTAVNIEVCVCESERERER